MAKFIKDPEFVEEKYYRLFFSYRDMLGAAWTVECDKDGNVDEENLSECMRKLWGEVKARLDSIRNGQDEEFMPPRVVERHHHFWTPAILQCDCGEEIELYRGSDSDCEKCGAEYNSAGQRLAPRHHWGEETGEDWRDIVRPYRDDEDF